MKKRKKRTSIIPRITILFFFVILVGIFLGKNAERKTQNYSLSYEEKEELTEEKSNILAFSCPTTSNQTYESIPPSGHGENKINNPENNPEINFSFHEWTQVNEAKEPVNYGGDTDPNPPPSFGSIFMGRYPEITNTYMIYHQKPQTEYDFCISNAPPGSFCPKVTLIGLRASPGEPLLGLTAGRKIFADYTLLVLFADKNTITFTHSNGDVWPADGYPIYVHDICVDPNLLSTYMKDNSEGRRVLPAVRAGQIFGYAKDTDVKVTIRDSGQWMDPRAKKDWWQYGPFSGPTYSPVNPPVITVIPSLTPLSTLTPSVTNPPTSSPQPSIAVSIIPSITTPVVPTSIPNPTVQPTLIPTITPFPTPTKTLTQIIVTSPIFNFISKTSKLFFDFFEVSLP